MAKYPATAETTTPVSYTHLARSSFLPTLSIQPITGLSAGVLAAYAAWLLLPTALHLGEQMLWRIKVSRL